MNKLIITIILSSAIFASCQQQPQAVEFNSIQAHQAVMLDSTLSSKSPLCEVSVDMQMLSSQDEYQDSVCRCINAEIFDNIFNNRQHISPQQLIEKYVADMIDEYNTATRADYHHYIETITDTQYVDDDDEDITKESFSHTSDIKSKAIMGYEDMILVYEVERMVYNGGAHPVSAHTYLNFNIYNGRRIRIEDIIRDGEKGNLLKMLKQKLMRQTKSKTEEDLLQKGYFELDDLFIPEHFMLYKDCIKFHYNVYEISSYSNGETVLTFSYEDLKHILDYEKLR